ncbi:uncharacterized protein LOC126881203 [Diabrotica virgifera virgifera]|uniref:Gamma-interferon-inducible lysosomal thiol reductase-like n=1 Tax=Diabrotica virgifera virgifera TaxID=50390 RepID=A0ABM5JTJ9_DIAVI|nr:uncharacterized protein LOC126881203 [Diabrotica virgifera virgifera]
MNHIIKEYLILCVLFFVRLNKSESYGPRIIANVYYESKCPYDKSFIEQQLLPIMEGNLTNYVNLTILPFGSPVPPHKFECFGPVDPLCSGHIDYSDNYYRPIPTGIQEWCFKKMICYLKKLKQRFEKRPITSKKQFCDLSDLSFGFLDNRCSIFNTLNFDKPNNSSEKKVKDNHSINLRTKRAKPDAIITLTWETSSECMDK